MPNSFLHRIKSWRNNTKLREQLTEGVLAAFVVLIPFQWSFPPISLVMMLMGLVFFFFFEKGYFQRFMSHRYLWLLIGYYAWVLVGMTYTGFPDEGSKDVQVQIALFAWPLGLAGLGAVTLPMVRRLLMLFVRAVTLSSLMCLAIATYSFLQDGETSHFFYKNIAAWPLIPQHYMGMYISFAILILLHNGMERRKSFTKRQAMEWVISLSVFLLMEGLLSVRIQYVALPLALLPFLYNAIKNKKLGKNTLKKAVLLLTGLALVFSLLPGTQRRIIETYHEIRSFNRVVEKKQTNHRVYLWRFSTEVIGENWLLGTGTGGGNEALHLKLKDCEAKFWDGTGVYYLRDKKYNAHNVFLQAWMTHGIIGFLLVTSILLIPLIRALQRKDALVAGFLILTLVSFSTESMLERQAGVLWFSCFYALLVVSLKGGYRVHEE